MKKLPSCAFALLIGWLAAPAVADDRAVITDLEQRLADAIASGGVATWNKYLAPEVIFAEEDGTYKSKAEMLLEIRPLPEGISGSIRVELLAYHEKGAVAVALFRQNEIEDYFGQTLHAKYLTSTTWSKGAAGWQLIAAQVLAEKSDPPVIPVPPPLLAQYVGQYRLGDSGETYSLKVMGGELRGMRDGGKDVIWHAEAADVFFLHGDPRIRKIFQRNAAGTVTGFVERRESWDTVWTKTNN